jgi:CS domain
MTTLQPQLKWAQRKDKLYLTVDLQDCESPDVKVTNVDGSGKFEFRGTAEGNQYELVVDLFGEVDTEDVQIANTARHAFLIVPKKEEGDHWPRLTKEKGKQNHIQVDWSKYIDQEDEEAGEDGFKPEGMGSLGDMGGMGGMPGMGGMGGMPGMGGMGGMPGMGGAGGAPGGLDMAQLQQMMAAQGAGGMGDMGGAAGGEGDDSDDEDLPDLEG